jgi:hypothetical protein
MSTPAGTRWHFTTKGGEDEEKQRRSTMYDSLALASQMAHTYPERLLSLAIDRRPRSISSHWCCTTIARLSMILLREQLSRALESTETSSSLLLSLR